MEWVLGIDPGKAGGFALVYSDLSVETWSMPKSEAKIIRLIEEFAGKDGCSGIYLEAVWGQKGSAMRAVTTFMKHTGFLKGSILTAFDILSGDFPLFFEVTPQKWQSELGATKSPKQPAGTKAAGVRKRIHKNNLKDLAVSLWPDHKFTLLTCDAALIARWGANKLWVH